MNIVVVPQQDEVSVFADASGVTLTQEDAALAASGDADAVQSITIPSQHIDALIKALREAKKEARR